MCPRGSGRVVLAAVRPTGLMVTTEGQRASDAAAEETTNKMATYPRAGAGDVPAQPDFPELWIPSRCSGEPPGFSTWM